MIKHQQRDCRHPLCGKTVAMTIDAVRDTVAFGHAESALLKETLFLHASNMSDRYVEFLSALLAPGDMIDVIVLDYDSAREHFDVSRATFDSAQKIPMGRLFMRRLP